MILAKRMFAFSLLPTTMRRLNPITLISILCLAFGVGVWIGNNPASVVRLSPSPLPSAPHWRSGVHLIHNAWFIWRDSPFGDLFTGAEVLIPAAIAWIALAAFIGMAFPQHRRLSTAGWALTGLVPVSFLIGRDPVSWSFLAGTMVLTATLAISSPPERQAPTSAPTPGNIEHQHSALRRAHRWLVGIGQVSGIAIAACLSLQFFSFAICLALVTLPTALHRNLSKTVWVGIALSALILTSYTPGLAPLDYPQEARVADWSEATEIARPLVGPQAPIPVIDIQGMQNRLAVPLLIIAVCTTACLLVPSLRVSAGHIFVLVLLVIMDVIPIRRVQESSILLAVGRLFPHGATYPMAWLCAAYIPLMLTSLVIRSQRKLIYASWLLTSGIIIGLASKHNDLPPPLLHGTTYQRLAENVLFTPSRLVLEQSEREVFATLRHQGALPHSLQELSASIDASSHPEEAQTLLSPGRHERWSPGGGEQRGSEWLAVRFSSPQTLVGVLLDSGDYWTDFARGIEISTSASCPDDWLHRHDSTSLRPIVAIDDWLGPIELTPSRLPYYGKLPQMKIFFPRETSVQCLLIRQTGHAHNDWSVAQIRVFTKKPAKKAEV